MRYSDYFSCCGEHWVVDIPYEYGVSHPHEFSMILYKHEQVKRDHRFCHIIQGIKKYLSDPEALLKQPVIIQVNP